MWSALKLYEEVPKPFSVNYQRWDQHSKLMENFTTFKPEAYIYTRMMQN